MAEELTEDQLNLLRQSFDYARTGDLTRMSAPSAVSHRI